MSKERYELRYVGDWYCYVYDNEKQQGADICSLDDSVRIFNEQDKKIKDLETKLADLQQEQVKEMQEHQEAMLVADNTIKMLEKALEMACETIKSMCPRPLWIGGTIPAPEVKDAEYFKEIAKDMMKNE